MLGKLLKYEFRSTARLFGLCYGVLLVLSVLAGLSLRGSFDALEPVSTAAILLYVAVAVAIWVLTIVMIIQRFYKSLLQGEGYLMHTLPVRMGSHIGCKLIAAVVWFVCSILVSVASVLLMGLCLGQSILNLNLSLDALAWWFQVAEAYFECPAVVGILLFGLAVLLGIAAMVLFFYLCLAVGHMAARRKLLCSFGAYLVLMVAGELLIDLVTEHVQLDLPVYGELILYCVGFAAACAVFFGATDVLMSKKLNLE